MISEYERRLCWRIVQLEKENEELRREKIEWVDLAMQGEAVRHKAMLELALGMTLDKKGT